MEPIGQMDSAKSALNKTQSEIWDVADEEVHFSRDAISSHYNNNQQPFNSHIIVNNQPTSSSSSSSAAATATHHHNHNQIGTDYYSTNHNAGLDSLSDVSLHNYQPVFGNETQDQAKSSKILHSIGLKLRRGSNYLIAPKLMGQYLLGITIQNWSEFLNTSRMMRAPSTTNQLSRRLVANLSHFQGNYLCVSLVLVVYCILTSPLLLLAIAGYLFAMYMVTARSATGRQLTLIGNFRPNLHQQYSFITLISLPLLWVAGAPSAVFWVIGASFVVVGLHASMYSNEKVISELSQDHHHHHQNYQLSSSHLRVPSTVQYYNHYPTTSGAAAAAAALHHRQYISIPNEMSSIQSPSVIAAAAVATTTTTTSTYANSLAQWMSFGASRNNTTDKLATTSGASTKKPKELEVTIISQHYAGLGRVYEV